MYQSETYRPDYHEGHTGVTAVSFGVLRVTDGQWWDFDDNSFKASGWTTPFKAMVEEPNPDATGESSWMYTTGWLIPNVDSTYKIKFKVTDATGTFYADGDLIIINDAIAPEAAATVIASLASSVTTIKENILYGLGEGMNIANATYLEYALRWANAAYRDIFLRHRFTHLRTRSIFRTADGQQTYQAPADFMGYLVLKDESKETVLDQITPEEFARKVDAISITDESFTSSFDTAVSLDNNAIEQYSETVTTTDGTTIYTRVTDYNMDYDAGKITVLSTGSMADATEYEIDYLYYTSGDPIQFCLEYDAANGKYVFRLDPVPDAIKIMSLLWLDVPSDLGASTAPIWSRLSYAIERGGIHFGSLEIINDAQERLEFRQIYEEAFASLVRLDMDLVSKPASIPLVLRKTDYTARTFAPIGTTGIR